jgi:hypothetical protein
MTRLNKERLEEIRGVVDNKYSLHSTTIIELLAHIDALQAELEEEINYRVDAILQNKELPNEKI